MGSSALAVRPPVMMAAALTVWLRTGHVVRRRGSIESLAMGRALAMGRSLTVDRGLAMDRDLAMGRRLAMNRDLATCSGPTWE